MKILHTADWHIGNHPGPEENGVNLRAQDTLNCLAKMVETAVAERPDYSLVSGDIFDRAEIWQGRSHKEVLQARHYIAELSKVSKHVVVMRGTPNHDSGEAFEELKAHFEYVPNVHVITSPQVLDFDDINIAVVPGFDRGVYRAKFPGLSKEDENEVFTQELSNVVVGLKAQCDPAKTSILMAHYTVPGCNTESGQTMALTQFEPIIPSDALRTADYDMACLGHIHRPQQLEELKNTFYAGGINAFNFGDEGQERGYWIHEGQRDIWTHTFHKTPYREFITFHFTDTDITALNLGDVDAVAFNWWRHNGAVIDKIVRIRYECSFENNKALNKAELERVLLADGAFWVKEIVPEKISEFADRQDLSDDTDPEANLKLYLEEKGFPDTVIQNLIIKARPIIAQAEASMSTVTSIGTFEPVEISVKNYRNYEEETFSFEDVHFCTINGQNGAGKSSLFMDAIIDCLYEEPREGDLTGWIRNDEKARSGSIMFTFRIGAKIFRVTRTRSKSGKITLNLAELVNEEWVDRSMEKKDDTQEEIVNILGMDSLTFKSCALIMQDQYGLFLQAPKEDRMVILGNLLGLGVYQAMEDIAREKAKSFGAQVKSMNQEIEIHEHTIKSLGNPEQHIESLSQQIETAELSLKAKTEERDKYKLILSQQEEAAARLKKMVEGINTLRTKKTATAANMDAQRAVIESCTSVIDQKPIIAAKIEEYNQLLEKERGLATEAALYASKLAEVEECRTQEQLEQSHINGLNEELTENTVKKVALEVYKEHEEEIRNGVAEYEKYFALHQEMLSLKSKRLEAAVEWDAKIREARDEVSKLERDLATTRAKQAELTKKTEILDNSGCPDIENASCRFLSDALEAKKELPAISNGIEVLMAAQSGASIRLTKTQKEADMALEAIGYDENLLKEYAAKVVEYKDYPDRLKELDATEGKIAVIKTSIENIQTNIAECETRLSTVKLRTSQAEQELERYRQARVDHVAIQNTLETFLIWIEKEKEVPVAEAKLETASARLAELTKELEDITAELAEKEAEYQTAGTATVDADLASKVEYLDRDIAAYTSVIGDYKMEIGGWKEKQEQINTLRCKIEGVLDAKIVAAEETADYDRLKAAFSQDGIPHQIIRTVIPRITSTANQILGQMTGGKMGVDFRTEKTQKSNSKKEVVTLDIFIEEYGKAPLPYLSKSGGEKVKSSLSVILALAEVKASSAGMQLGFLAVDEPPFLDGDGTQAYVDALETIQNRYQGLKVMAITHDQEFKARFPQSLTVFKDDHGSHVKWD